MPAGAATTVLGRPRPPSRATSPWSLSRLSRQELTGRALFLAMLLSALVLGAVLVVNASRWIDKPFAGFLMNERMIPGNVGQYHWTGTRAGVTYPDRILTAAGQPIGSMTDLERVIARTPLGDPITYTVERRGRVIEVTVPTMRFTWADFLVAFAIPFVSGLIFLAIGVVVFLLKPDTRASWALLIACFCLSVYTMVTFETQSAHWGVARLSMVALAFFPGGFVHLSSVFPERWQLVERHPRLQLVPYALSAALMISMELLYPRPAFAIPYRLVFAYMIVAALALAASSLHAYFRRASVLARQRAKVVLAGAAFALPVPAVAHYLSLFQGVPVQGNFLAIPIIVFPASVAYAIAKHNLFDVDVYIKRAVGYAIMTLVVGAAYASMQTILSRLLAPVFGEARETVYPIVFALLVVLFFNPLNRRVQDSVDRIFFRAQFDYKKTVSAVSNLLTSMLNLDQIIMQVIYTIRSEMFVDTAGVIVLDPKNKACRTFFLGDAALHGAEGVLELPVGWDDPLLALVREEKALVTRYDIEEDHRFALVRDACLQRFSEMAATVVIPLLYQDRITGVLALGRKKSGHFYSREDVELLTTMADQAAVAIENATTHEEVVRYAEELAASLRRIQILESIKTSLAKFVPRTVQELIEESPEAPSLEKREIDVSVLFADITGYTRLSAQMDMEHVNRIVERYFGAFLDEILSRGGDVNETAGDGLMVIFRKKDPRRHARAAVLAALGIQQRAREINAELTGQHEPIVMKVGVNSGIASVGATRIEGAAGTRWTYTASGPTTNVAARLAALAEGADGGVIVSEETRGRLEDPFLVEDLGPQALKNVPRPVRAFRVVGRGGPSPAGPDPSEEGRAALRLYIVSREHPEVYEELKRRHEHDPDVEVIVDRRVGERQQRVVVEVAERRLTDRRSRPDVDTERPAQSHTAVRADGEPGAAPPEGPTP